MASAGRILIMPKGSWKAETEYEMLDLVEHENRAWIAKKVCKGIEPSDANSEYWHDMFKEGLAYLPLTGGEVTGSILAIENRGDAFFARRTIEGVEYEHSMGGGSILEIGGENVADFTFKENETIKAQLVYNENGAGYVDKSKDIKNATIIPFHSGRNKPYQRYEGDGNAETKTINTGGIGKVLLVWSTYGSALLTPVGAVCFKDSNVSGLSRSECSYEDGTLTISTSSDFLNGNYTYHYQCL